jgi:TPR repeat protein
MPEEAAQWLRRAIEKGYNNWHYIKTSKTYRLSETIPNPVQKIIAGNRFNTH